MFFSLGCCCGSVDDGCTYGVIDGGEMTWVVNSFSTGAWDTGITASNLTSSVWGASGTSLLKVMFCGLVQEAVCATPILPSGTSWITACGNFLSTGGTIVVVAENTQSYCIDATELASLNAFLTAVGSAMQIAGGISSNYGNQLITGPSSSARKVLSDDLTLNSCRLSHGGGASVTGGTSVLNGIADEGGGGTVAVIAYETLNTYGRLVVLSDANFFDNTVPSRENNRFLDNLCGFTPCSLTRWTASGQYYNSSGIYNSGGSTSTLYHNFNEETVTHNTSGTSSSLFALTLSSTTYRWDMLTNGNGGIESFCITFQLALSIANCTYVDGNGDAVCPRVGLAVYHDSKYYTTIDTLALTVLPAPTSSGSTREYTLGPITPADLAAITGWPSGGASPAITASSALRYVTFGLAFLFDDATNGTQTRFTAYQIVLKLDCNCA